MIKIAIYQGGYPEGLDENISIMETQAKKAKEANADLILFCECFLGGYVSGDSFKSYSESTSGENFSKICNIARSTGVRIERSRFWPSLKANTTESPLDTNQITIFLDCYRIWLHRKVRKPKRRIKFRQILQIHKRFQFLRSLRVFYFNLFVAISMKLEQPNSPIRAPSSTSPAALSPTIANCTSGNLMRTLTLLLETNSVRFSISKVHRQMSMQSLSFFLSFRIGCHYRSQSSNDDLLRCRISRSDAMLCSSGLSALPCSYCINDKANDNSHCNLSCRRKQRVFGVRESSWNRALRQTWSWFVA